MNQQEIDRLWDSADGSLSSKRWGFGVVTEWRGFTKDQLTAAIQEAVAQARRQALDEAASLIRNAAQRAVDKEYHKTFALLLMLAGDIDKLKDTSDLSAYLTLINEGNIEQASQPQWIPVSERLPDAFPVWGTNAERQFRVDSLKNFGYDGWRARMHVTDKTILFPITHWMPLPALPQSA